MFTRHLTILVVVIAVETSLSAQNAEDEAIISREYVVSVLSGESQMAKLGALASREIGIRVDTEAVGSPEFGAISEAVRTGSRRDAVSREIGILTRYGDQTGDWSDGVSRENSLLRIESSGARGVLSREVSMANGVFELQPHQFSREWSIFRINPNADAAENLTTDVSNGQGRGDRPRSVLKWKFEIKRQK